MVWNEPTGGQRIGSLDPEHTHTHTRARTHAHKKKGEKNHNHPMNCRRCERAAVVVGVQWLDDGVVASRG